MDIIKSYKLNTFFDFFKGYKIPFSLLLVLQAIFIIGILINPLVAVVALTVLLITGWAVKNPLNLLCLVIFYSCITVPNPGKLHAPYFILIGVRISVIELLFVGCLCLLFIRSAVNYGLKHKFEKGSYLKSMVIFSLCLFAGLFVGIINNASIIDGINEIRNLFYLPFIYFITINIAKSKNDIRKIIISLIGGMTVYSILGLLWHINHISHGGSLSLPIDIYHSSLMLTFVLFLTLIFYINKYSNIYIYNLNIILILLFLYNLLFNYRRAIYLGFAFGLIIVLLALIKKDRKLLRKLIIPAIIMLLILVIIGPNYLSGISERALSVTEIEYYGQEGAAASNFYRLWEMGNFLHNIKNAPIFGLGAGLEWEVYIPFPSTILTSDHFHNTHAALWLKYGIYTLITFVAMSLIACWTCIKRGIKENDPLVYSTYFACAGYFICFLIASIFGDYMYYVRPPFWLGVIFGIASFSPAKTDSVCCDSKP